MNDSIVLSRRQALVGTAAVGAGWGFGLLLRPIAALAQPKGVEINSWIVIAPDNVATIMIPKQEMGQGSFTALAQFIAEELDLDWAKITPHHASPLINLTRNKVYGNMNSGASRGVTDNQVNMRVAGAQIRLMLLKAAAARLNVPEAELSTEKSIITHRGSNRRLTYAEVAADAAKLPVPDPKSITLRDPKEWKLIGKFVKRLDVPMKTDGSALYGIDIKLPGMKHAAIMTSPVFKGKLKSYDASVALARPGVLKVVEVKGSETGPGLPSDDGIAVVADTWWQAKTALEIMPKEWDGGENSNKNSAGYMADFKSAASSPVEKPSLKKGDVDAAMRSAAKSVEAEYWVPYLEHATMEPHNCTALVTDDRYEIWVGTQGPERALEVGSKVTGLPQTKGEVNIALLGGGFGRRSGPQDFVDQAVQIAKAMKGTPVKLVWSREEETRHSFFRPATLGKLRGGLDADGKLVAWQHRVITQSGNVVNSTLGSSDQGHMAVIPNVTVDHLQRPGHVPLGNMRGVAYLQTIYFAESFADELAVAAGKDSYQFRRSLLNPDLLPANLDKRDLVAAKLIRSRDVLDAAAKNADWGKPLGPNRGRGIALCEEANTVVVAVVEVTLDNEGWFTTDRVSFTVDSGFMVSPDGITSQMEGSAIYGLTAAYYGEITINNGRVVQGNFDDYTMMRIHETPKIEVNFAMSGKNHLVDWGGIGEPGVSPVAPALTNAIYNAGGPRIRSMPLKNENIVKRT